MPFTEDIHIRVIFSQAVHTAEFFLVSVLV